MDWNKIQDRIRNAEHPVSLCEVVKPDEFQACFVDIKQATYGEFDDLKLLCAICHIARLHASEGGFWSIVYEKMPVWVRDMLFLPNLCQPNEELKDRLRQTCKEWGLRHVFDDSDNKEIQRWYGSISLQYGFTNRGFKGHLPEWLMGHSQPVAVERLRDHPTLQSKSFRRLWKALEDYYAGSITADALRQNVCQSPWVLKEWSDDLIKVVDSRRCISRREGYRFIQDEEPEDVCILSTPKLSIEQGVENAHWQFCLQDLERLGLTESSYQLDVNNGSEQRLVDSIFLHRKSDGSYTNNDHSYFILFNDVPDGKVSIKLSGSELIHEEELTLFELDEDVIVFTAKGTLVKNFTQKNFEPGSYTLMIRNDLTIIPAPATGAFCTENGYELWRLTFEESQKLRIVFKDDGQELWTGRSRYKHPLELPDEFVLTCTPPDEEEIYDSSCSDITLEIAITRKNTFARASDIQITSAKWRQHKLADEFGGHWVLGSIPKAEAFGAISLKIWVRGKIDGRPFRDSVIWKPKVTGIIENKSTFVKYFSTRTIKQLDGNLCSVFSAALSEGTWGLFEGKRHLQNFVQGGILPKSGYLGLGEELVLRREPYECSEKVPLINEIVDTGIFLPSKSNPVSGQTFEFDVLSSPDFDDEYKIHFGVLGGVPSIDAAENSLILDEGKGLFSPFPVRPCDFLVLSYRGEHVGSWWRNHKDGVSWSSQLGNINTDEAAQNAIDIMCWAKLPVFSEKHVEDVRAFVCKFIHLFLCERVFSDKIALENVLVSCANVSEWTVKIRDAFFAQELPIDTEIKVLDYLKTKNVSITDTAIPNTLIRIGQVDPLLMGRLLLIVRERYSCTEGIWDDLVQQLYNKLDNTLFLSKKEDELYATVFENNGVGRNYAENMIEQASKIVKDRNVNIYYPQDLRDAMKIPEFYGLLCRKIFSSVKVKVKIPTSPQRQLFTENDFNDYEEQGSGQERVDICSPGTISFSHGRNHKRANETGHEISTATLISPLRCICRQDSIIDKGKTPEFIITGATTSDEMKIDSARWNNQELTVKRNGLSPTEWVITDFPHSEKMLSNTVKIQLNGTTRNGVFEEIVIWHPETE